MQPIQIFLIVGILIAAVFMLRMLRDDRSTAIKRILALLVALAGVVAILFPTLVNDLAQLLGVGRGTDLLLYTFIISALFFAVAMLKRQARASSRLTRLARAVALNDAREREAREGIGLPADGESAAGLSEAPRPE